MIDKTDPLGFWPVVDDPTEENLTQADIGDKFKILQFLPVGSYYLLEQLSTHSTRWVLEHRIRSNGVETAFYDADPTWLPPAARKK